MKKITLISLGAIAGSCAIANTLVQTNADYLAFDATSFTSATNWSALADTNSLADSVMVYADTLGIDASSGNAGAAAGDSLTFTLDFTSAGTYSLYVHSEQGIFDTNNNDSVYIPIDGDIEGTPTISGNMNGIGDQSAGYDWSVLDNGATSPGAGVEQVSNSQNNTIAFTITAQQAVAGQTVTFSLDGRENDFQLDRIVFAKNGSLDATTLDGLTVAAVPEPSAYALIAGSLALGWIMVRRRK